jgi:hypothetical protein
MFYFYISEGICFAVFVEKKRRQEKKKKRKFNKNSEADSFRNIKVKHTHLKMAM